jgi:hypothetical protein
MPKIEINQVAEILKRNKVDPAILRQVVAEMNTLAQAAAEEDKIPAVKKQFVILVSDPEGRFPKSDFAGWVLQIPEEESPVTTQDRIFRAAYEYNASKKGRLLAAKTVGDAIENVPAKHFKDAEVWVKTKTPVLVLTTNNEIPKDKSE